MTPVSSTDTESINGTAPGTGDTDSPDQSEKLICPICDEDMISLVQLNRHIDDAHTGNNNETKSSHKAPLKKTLRLDLFDDSNGFGLSDTNGEVVEGSQDQGQTHKITRSHWKQPIPGKANYCSQKSCKKLLNVRTGIVNCRKCGKLFCNDHTRYKVKLSDPPAKGKLPQYDSFGYFARCCETCYFEKPLVKLGTQVNSNDLTEQFTKIRESRVEEKRSKQDILQKRFIRLTSLLGEDYLWHTEHRSSVFLVFNSPRPPYTKEEYQEREKEIVGYEIWQVDDDVTHCPLCFVKFNMLIRKHHCRLCGTIVSDIAINSNDPSSMCSLQVPAGIFLELLPNLNYPPHISNNWDALVLINPASTRHAELFSFRCCRECKNTLLPKHNRDDTDETSALFATYNELLMLKAHISTAMPRYESLVSSNLDRQNEQINRLRAKLMKHLKDFETAIANLKQKLFRLDPNTKKHVPLMHPTLVTNIYKLTIVFLQDSLLHFKKINDEFQEMEKSRLTGQLGQLDTSSADEQSALSPEAASPSPAPPKPRLTKKQIRELREELMVVSEQQYLVNQQIAEAKKRRRFDEILALSENVSELEKRKSELENELGEFGFE